jgi:hypothetical protein
VNRRANSVKSFQVDVRVISVTTFLLGMAAEPVRRDVREGVPFLIAAPIAAPDIPYIIRYGFSRDGCGGQQSAVGTGGHAGRRWSAPRLDSGLSFAEAMRLLAGVASWVSVVNRCRVRQVRP